MRFSTIFTVLAAGTIAFASVVPEIVTKRSVADVQNAFTDLSNKCDTILPQFDSCQDDTCSDAIVVQLVAAIDACTNTLGGLSGGPGDAATAAAAADVAIKITTSLNSHKANCGSNCPDLIDIYAKIDVSFSLCLQAAFNLCIGLASLVSALLVNLVAILQGLSLTLILKVCLLL